MNQEYDLHELLQLVKTYVQAAPIAEEQPLLETIAEILRAYPARPLPPHNMNEIRGQEAVKRTLEVAAAGGHNILLRGPSGAGKGILAHAFSSLLPRTAVPLPIRVPYSDEALLGNLPFPGDLVLAHGGVLLLEDMAAFEYHTLSAVRQAVEMGIRILDGITYAAQFQLIATLKPCLCGFYGDPLMECTCIIEEIQSYHRHIQEMITCFDIIVEVPRSTNDTSKMRRGEPSEDIRARVERARERQRQRYAETTYHLNADLQTADAIERYCTLDKTAEKLLEAARRQLHLTPAQTMSLRRVARSSADLDDAQPETIGVQHMAEALQYRSRFQEY